MLDLNEFEKAYYNISFSFTLIRLIIEFLEHHYEDIEEMDDIIPILKCANEKLGSTYADFINKNII